MADAAKDATIRALNCIVSIFCWKIVGEKFVCVRVLMSG